jgi:cytochrome c peroxidase
MYRAVFVLLLIAGAAGTQTLTQAPPPPVPLGLVAVPWPADNRYSPAKAELGRLLYFDTRLSADGTISCSSCHKPEFAFTDGAATSTGIRGQKGNRSAPTIINRAYSMGQFWDGRAATLEDQAKGPMANPIEMGHSTDGIVAALKAIPGYRVRFKQVFGTEDITIDHVAKAITTFERTILSGNSPYDRFRAGQKNAMTASQQRGMSVFADKAKCDQCHEGISFTNGSFNNLGVGTDTPNPDPGYSAVTHKEEDWGKFKTPTLREIARTAPYMHDGSLATLEDVVQFYDDGGKPNRNKDERMKALHLSAQEKADLVDFLKALSGTGWQYIKAPTEFPK